MRRNSSADITGPGSSVLSPAPSKNFPFPINRLPESRGWNPRLPWYGWVEECPYGPLPRRIAFWNRSAPHIHRLPKNLKLQNEPSPIFGQCAVAPTPSSDSARAHPRYTKRTWQLIENK
jgi:hypothetical protein